MTDRESPASSPPRPDSSSHPDAPANRQPLARQVAIVTGASSGIGTAIARALAAAGACVVVDHRPNERSRAEGAEVVAAIREAGGTASAFAADVTNEDEVEAMVEDTVRRYGALDIMVANAGVEDPAPIEEMTLDAWRKVIDVNLTGAFITARAAARQFLRQGPRPDVSRATGKIIFTSSVHEFIPWAFQANYAASKGGTMLLMKSLAQELAPRGIRVNSIAPGAIRTPINADAWETDEARQKLLELIPYGRIGAPEDIGRAAAWLASDDADYIVGTSLVADGGMNLYPGFRGAG